MKIVNWLLQSKDFNLAYVVQKLKEELIYEQEDHILEEGIEKQRGILD